MPFWTLGLKPRTALLLDHFKKRPDVEDREMFRVRARPQAVVSPQSPMSDSDARRSEMRRERPSVQPFN
jgi:hypothetical protein